MNLFRGQRLEIFLGGESVELDPSVDESKLACHIVESLIKQQHTNLSLDNQTYYPTPSEEITTPKVKMNAVVGVKRYLEGVIKDPSRTSGEVNMIRTVLALADAILTDRHHD